MHLPRILVVDDDPSILKFVQANLKARGYRVFTAEGGAEAIQINGSEKPELVILDIIMPGIDGFEACLKIREQSNVPIIMLSAQERENDKERCTACGANDYLTKPFVLRELLSRIKTILKES
jgi:DNA-binding response OmpR family regulator